MAEWIARWTCNLVVGGSSPTNVNFFFNIFFYNHGIATHSQPPSGQSGQSGQSEGNWRAIGGQSESNRGAISAGAIITKKLIA